jgi:hypothetical protein
VPRARQLFIERPIPSDHGWSNPLNNEELYSKN